MGNSFFENIVFGKAPLMNGILYPDGTFHQVVICQLGRHSFQLEKYQEKKVDISEVEWIEFDTLSEVRPSDSDFCVKAGEGAFGGDGFVLLTKHEVVEWIAFFENSNPLSIVEADDEKAIVESDLGLRLSIPFSNPQNLYVI